MIQFCQYINGGSAIHRITLPEYPGRWFAAYVDTAGKMTDASSSSAYSWGTNYRVVHQDGKQWRTLASKSKILFDVYTRESTNA